MSARFDISDTPLRGVKVLQRKTIGDHRGYLERLYCAEELRATASDLAIAQINHTYTASRGTVRGMHFQHPPHAEVKFVSCLRGEVFDVAVDLRRDSPTFLQWHAERLSGDNHRTLVIPRGCAHGFQALTDDCEMLYFHSAGYQPNAEGGMNPLDPRLAIAWPLDVSDLSERDAGHPFIDAAFQGVVL